jgi:hypothetical protein
VSSAYETSNLKSIYLHGNQLSQTVPYFSVATNCTVQVGNATNALTTSNSVCCPKGLLHTQPCCLSTTLCGCSTNLTPFAPVPDRCLLDPSDPIDHALCMTVSTLDDESDLQTESVFYDNSSYVVFDNFTVMFWVRARQPLNHPQAASSVATDWIPRGGLFWPRAVFNASSRGVGVYLGTDGISVYETTGNIFTPVLVFRGPLIGWHHVAVVYTARRPAVFVDFQLTTASVAPISPTVPVGMRVVFGRTRFRWLWDGGVAGVGFEGWISNLQIANQTMSAVDIQNTVNESLPLDFANYDMNGCSGENHTGTSIDRFQLQQAFLVCRDAQTYRMPSCGADNNNGSFAPNEPAGCLVLVNNATTTCVAGSWSPADGGMSVVSNQLVAQWRFDNLAPNATTVPDLSGNGFHGAVLGNASTLFYSSTFVDVGDLPFANFGSADFTIEVWIRVVNSTARTTIIGKRDVCGHESFFDLQLQAGVPTAEIDQDGSGTNYLSLNAATVLAPGQWHRVHLLRTGPALSIYVDLQLKTGSSAAGTAIVYNSARLQIGTMQACAFPPIVADVANISIYYGNTVPMLSSQPSQPTLCAFAGGTFTASPSLLLMNPAYSNVVGFCAPLKESRACCAVTDGCTKCDLFTTCNPPPTSSTTTTTTTTTPSTATTTMTLITTIGISPVATSTSPATTSQVTPQSGSVVSVGSFTQTLFSATTSTLTTTAIDMMPVVQGQVFSVCRCNHANYMCVVAYSCCITASHTNRRWRRRGRPCDVCYSHHRRDMCCTKTQEHTHR